MVQQIDIRGLQALTDPQFPLNSLNENKQEEKLVEIAGAILRCIPDSDMEHSPAPDTLQPLRTLPVNLSGLCLYATDEEGCFWLSHGQQLKVIPINRDHHMRQRILPNQHWKQHLARTWCGGLVVSDWAGSLYRFDSESQREDEWVYQAQGDDLPIHLLELGSDGRLVTATWNGRIRTWDSNRMPVPPSLTLTSLPLHLIPLADGGLVVIDQANMVCFYDATGKETRRWQGDETIKGVWSCAETEGPTVIVLLGRHRVAKVNLVHKEVKECRFGEPIESLCLYQGQHEENFLCVARQGGFIDWLSVSPLSLIIGAGTRSVPAVRQLFSLPWTPLFPSSEPVALGLTVEGQIFLVRPNNFLLYSAPRAVTHLLVDPSGRFLLSCSEREIGLYRNPAVGPVICRIIVVEVIGDLMVGASNKLTVILKNKSLVTIWRVKAELDGRGSIDLCRCDEFLVGGISSDETFTLEFSVRARITGDAVPLVLKLFPEDEGGPSSQVEVRLNVVSKGSSHDG
jgi:hypothetical protein